MNECSCHLVMCIFEASHSVDWSTGEVLRATDTNLHSSNCNRTMSQEVKVKVVVRKGFPEGVLLLIVMATAAVAIRLCTWCCWSVCAWIIFPLVLLSSKPLQISAPRLSEYQKFLLRRIQILYVKRRTSASGGWQYPQLVALSCLVRMGKRLAKCLSHIYITCVFLRSSRLMEARLVDISEEDSCFCNFNFIMLMRIAPAVSQNHTPTPCGVYRRPYDSGEVIVQNYNTLLTLSHLLDATDGIILVNQALIFRTVPALTVYPEPLFRYAMVCNEPGRQGTLYNIVLFMEYDACRLGRKPAFRVHKPITQLNSATSQHPSKEKCTKPTTYLQVQNIYSAGCAPPEYIAEVPSGSLSWASKQPY